MNIKNNGTAKLLMPLDRYMPAGRGRQVLPTTASSNREITQTERISSGSGKKIRRLML